MTLTPNEIATLREALRFHEDNGINKCGSLEKIKASYESRQKMHFHEDTAKIIRKILSK